jgi:hypothetical protein
MRAHAQMEVPVRLNDAAALNIFVLHDLNRQRAILHVHVSRRVSPS